MTTPSDEIRQHIERHIGPIRTTYKEIVSDDLTIDLHHVKSTLFRRFEVVVTSGMSARRMNVPAEQNQPAFVELLVLLPKGWPMEHSGFADERNYWPLRLLKDLARYTHHSDTWLGFGHTVAHGESHDGMVPYADDTRLCACVILPSSTFGEPMWSLQASSGEQVMFWCAVPLHASELRFKMEHGVDALLDLFDRHKVTDRIDPKRAPVV